MAGVDLLSFTNQTFNRLKTDAAGSAVRAKVGIGAVTPADSIIHAEQLKQYTQNNVAPLRPLLALRGGVVGGQSMDMRTALFTWWIYDDPSAKYARINELVKLIEQAYPFDAFSFVRVQVTNIGAETSDQVLGWFVRPLQLALITRG